MRVETEDKKIMAEDKTTLENTSEQPTAKSKKDKPKKEKKEKTPKEPKTKAASDEKLDAILGGINTLAGAVSKLVDIQTADKRQDDVRPEQSKREIYSPPLDDETYPNQYIPRNYRKIVDEVLSPEFGIKIDDFPDRTDFQLNIIVPERYSSVTAEDRVKGVQDIRSRMIPRALGENGVREWCMLIRNNLNRHFSKQGVGSPFQSAAE